jgi:hypothetical protein
MPPENLCHNATNIRQRASVGDCWEPSAPNNRVDFSLALLLDLWVHDHRQVEGEGGGGALHTFRQVRTTPEEDCKELTVSNPAPTELIAAHRRVSSWSEERGPPASEKVVAHRFGISASPVSCKGK